MLDYIINSREEFLNFAIKHNYCYLAWLDSENEIVILVDDETKNKIIIKIQVFSEMIIDMIKCLIENKIDYLFEFTTCVNSCTFASINAMYYDSEENDFLMFKYIIETYQLNHEVDSFKIELIKKIVMDNGWRLNKLDDRYRLRDYFKRAKYIYENSNKYRRPLTVKCVPNSSYHYDSVEIDQQRKDYYNCKHLFGINIYCPKYFYHDERENKIDYIDFTYKKLTDNSAGYLTYVDPMTNLKREVSDNMYYLFRYYKINKFFSYILKEYNDTCTSLEGAGQGRVVSLIKGRLDGRSKALYKLFNEQRKIMMTENHKLKIYWKEITYKNMIDVVDEFIDNYVGRLEITLIDVDEARHNFNYKRIEKRSASERNYWIESYWDKKIEPQRISLYFDNSFNNLAAYLEEDYSRDLKKMYNIEDISYHQNRFYYIDEEFSYTDCPLCNFIDYSGYDVFYSDDSWDSEDWSVNNESDDD